MSLESKLKAKDSIQLLMKNLYLISVPPSTIGSTQPLCVQSKTHFLPI
jgi:hypothetical protein